MCTSVVCCDLNTLSATIDKVRESALPGREQVVVNEALRSVLDLLRPRPPTPFCSPEIRRAYTRQ
jgi:hypothetical protein